VAAVRPPRAGRRTSTAGSAIGDVLARLDDALDRVDRAV
jgi:Ser/Thr protein kinase RdoA (MazF antagonist)